MPGDVDLKQPTAADQQGQGADRSKRGTSAGTQTNFLRGRERYRFGSIHSRQNLRGVGRVASLVKTSTRISGRSPFGNRGKDDSEEVNASPWGVGTNIDSKKSAQGVDEKASHTKALSPTDKHAKLTTTPGKQDIEVASSPISTIGSENGKGTQSQPYALSQHISGDERMLARRASSMVALKSCHQDANDAETPSIVQSATKASVVDVGDEVPLEAPEEEVQEGSIHEVVSPSRRFRHGRSRANSKQKAETQGETPRGIGIKLLSFARFTMSKRQNQILRSKSKPNEVERKTPLKNGWRRSKSAAPSEPVLVEKASSGGDDLAVTLDAKSTKSDAGNKAPFAGHFFVTRRGESAGGGDDKGRVDVEEETMIAESEGGVSSPQVRHVVRKRDRIMGRRLKLGGASVDLDEDAASDEDEIDRECIIRSLAVDDFILYQTKHLGPRR